MFLEYSSVISDATCPQSEPLRAETQSFVDIQHASTSDTLLQYQTNWTKCVWYEKGINEELSCPEDGKHSILTIASCKTLADNLLGFCKIDSLQNTN